MNQLSFLKPRGKRVNSHGNQKQGTYDAEKFNNKNIIAEADTNQGDGIKKDNRNSNILEPRLKLLRSSHHRAYLHLAYFVLDYLYDHIPVFRHFVIGIKQRRGHLGRFVMRWVDWLYEERPDTSAL